MATASSPSPFRTQETLEILNFIKAGDSCMVVGIGSVGKSNLLRSLPGQVAGLLPEKSDKAYLFVYVDPNKRVECSPWGLYELVLHQLLIALSEKGIDREHVDEIDRLYQRAYDPVTQHLALRCLDRAFFIVCGSLKFSVVLMLDEFDMLCPSLLPQTFAALRAMRDDHKYHLMYIVAARRPTGMSCQNSIEMETFVELLSPNTVWLGPYNEPDALLTLKNIARRYGVEVDAATLRNILAKTGGHPGLIRTAFLLFYEKPDDWEQLIEADERIFDECYRIWYSITPADQSVLLNLALGRPAVASQKALDSLRRKKVIGETGAKKDSIFSSVFEAFLKREKPPVGARIFVDAKRRIVTVDGRSINDLSRLEFGFVEYLEKHRNQVCTRDDLVRCLYPGEIVAEGVTENRLDSLVKRVRKAIEPDPEEPEFIVTVRGHGYKLEDGESITGEKAGAK